jgi:acetyl esterase/lipase
MISRFCLILGIAVAASGVRAAETSTPFVLVEDVVYGHKDGLALSMDILTPEKNPKGIGVVLVSSGGWRSHKSGDPQHEEARRRTEHWVQGLLQGGYTLFVARHGSAPRYFVPEMVGDMRRAVRYVRTHADRYKVDPKKIGITSGSSGGHLSLMEALTADDGNATAKDPIDRASCRVQAVVAWFPPTDLINWGVPGGYKLVQKIKPEMLPGLFGKVTDIEGQLKSISPIYHVTKESPPLLLIHGDRDTTVPLQQSKILQAKYDELGVPVKLIVQPGGGHTYWPGIMEQYPAVWEWFDKYLGVQAQAAK